MPVDFAAVVLEGVACLLCCLPTPPLAAPYPPDPLPRRGRGRPRLFHARGFAPCIPGAEPGRHRSRGRIARWRGACSGVADSPRRRCLRWGGLPSLPSAYPPSVYFPAPYPPSPRSQSALPRWGRGSPRLFHARGCAPCIPGAEPGRHRSRGANRALAGACLLCRLPTLPLACFPAPYPPDPLPRRGRGRLKVYFAGGSAPGTPAPRHPGTPAPRHPGTPAPRHPGTPAPRHPGTEPLVALAEPAKKMPSGGRGGFGCRLTLPLWCLKGWLAFFAACLPCL